MSFTDQLPRIASEQDVAMPWNGGKNGKYFRCYLCGHKFVVGDYWRFIFGNSSKYYPPTYPRDIRWNIIVCEKCDVGMNETILEKYQDLYDRAWSIRRE